MLAIRDGLTRTQRYRKRHPERVTWAATGGATEERKQANRDAKRRSTFGSDAVEYYGRLMVEQKGCCAVCEKPFVRTASQDHDHRCCPSYPTCGGCRRGLVCQSCNTGLFFAEHPEWLEKAKEYLRKWHA